MIIRHKGKASESLLKKILEVLERRQRTSRYPLEWIMLVLLCVLQQSLWLDQRSLPLNCSAASRKLLIIIKARGMFWKC